MKQKNRELVIKEVLAKAFYLYFNGDYPQGEDDNVGYFLDALDHSFGFSPEDIPDYKEFQK